MNHKRFADNAPSWDVGDKIFGRDQETWQLRDILTEHRKNVMSMVAIHGLAGSGKSSLVQSYPWHEEGYLLSSGKFETHRTSEPYSAVIEALEYLVEHWIANDEKAVTSRINELQNLVETEIGVLKNVLPKLFQIVGVTKSHDDDSQITMTDDDEKSKLIEFSSTDAVNAAFHQIFSFLCSTQPVVLFLDDIQWADKGSMDVIHTFMSLGSIEQLLLIVSYRNEEVDEKHLVTSYLDNIRKMNILVHDIHIKDLDVDGVNSLLAHLLKSDLNETHSLAEVIHNKTAGNPFFVLQFLRLLRDEKFITFSYPKFKWEWGDTEKLQSIAHISDNVAEVIAVAMQRLPLATQAALKVASCLGKVVPLCVLCEYFNSSFLLEDPSNFTHVQDLLHIQREDLEKVLDSAADMGGILIRFAENGSVVYSWSHDKLQQCAYSLIPESMRASLHMCLGKLLWKKSLACPDEEWMIFTAADQLNRYSKLENKTSLGVDVARLNLAAAKIIMKKSALFPAWDMLRAAAKNLDGTNAWAENYNLTLRVFNHLAEIGIRVGQYEHAMEAVRMIEEHGKCIDDKFRANCAMLTIMTSGNNRDYDAGVTKTLEILKMYGEKIPSKLLPGQLFIENQKLKSKFPGGRPDGVMNLPEMTDSRSYKVTKLLMRHLAAASVHSQKYHALRPLAAVRTLIIASKKGVCDLTAQGLVNFAVNLKADGHYQESKEYGELAIKLIDKFPLALGSPHCIVKLSTYLIIFPVMLPFNVSLDGMVDCHRIGMKTGETERAATALVGYAWTYLCTGLPLGPFYADMVSYGKQTKTLNVPYTIQVLFKVWQQMVLNLQTKKGNDIPTLLMGDAMNQADELEAVKGPGVKMTLRDINTFRLMLSCIYNDWKTAETMLDELEEYLSFDIFAQRYHLRLTYFGLAAFAVNRKSGGKKKKYRTLGKKVLKIFKTEVERGSVNAYPVLKMLEAEESPSKETYEEAIRTCARLGMMHHEAYMCERAAEFFLEENGDSDWARIYLDRTLARYNDWGAVGKSAALLGRYEGIMSTEFLYQKSTSLKGRERFEKRDSIILEHVDWSSLAGIPASNQ